MADHPSEHSTGHDGDEVFEDPLADPEAPFKALGVSGLRRFGGRIQDDLLRELWGTKGARVLREISENEPIASAIVFAVKFYARSADWGVEPAGDDTAEVEKAAYLQSTMDDMDVPWTMFISETLEEVIYGYALHEVIFKRRFGEQPPLTQQIATSEDGTYLYPSKHDDGQIGWAKLMGIDPQTIEQWIFDDDRADATHEVIGFIQQAAPKFERQDLPISKFLHFVTEQRRDNPEGRSMLRGAYRPAWYKRRLEEIEAIGTERDLAGLPFARVPGRIANPDAGDADAVQALRDWEEMMRRIRRDDIEGIVYSSDKAKDGQSDLYEVGLMSTGGARQIDIDKSLSRKSTEIAISVLADFVILGHQNVGSFALASVKTNIFAIAMNVLIQSIADTINNQAVPMLFRMNGVEPNVDGKYPTIIATEIETPDLDAIAKFLQTVSGAGSPIFPDPEMENWWRGLIGAPLLTEEAIGERDAEAEMRAEIEEELRAQQDAEANLANTNTDHLDDDDENTGHEDEDDS